MACLTMSWALILLNKYKVVIHATNRVELTLFSTENKKIDNVTSDIYRLQIQIVQIHIIASVLWLSKNYFEENQLLH